MDEMTRKEDPVSFEVDRERAVVANHGRGEENVPVPSTVALVSRRDGPPLLSCPCPPRGIMRTGQIG